MRLENKVAIITGSASGIGKGIALAMAKEGARIAIVDINEEKGQETLAEINKISEGLLFIKDISVKAIRGISRVAAEEWGPFGINVNIISPIALTPGVDVWRNNEPDAYETMVSGIPMRRLGDPEKDIGRTAVFLASEDSDYITGQTIMVDGGSIKLR